VLVLCKFEVFRLLHLFVLTSIVSC
jgi:hypothetical protein